MEEDRALQQPTAAGLVEVVEAEELCAGGGVHALGALVGGAGALQHAPVLLALEHGGAGRAVADVGERAQRTALLAEGAAEGCKAGGQTGHGLGNWTAVLRGHEFLWCDGEASACTDLHCNKLPKTKGQIKQKV